MKLAKNHSKIYKTHTLSVGMAAMHTTSSLDREMLQISSFGELEYSSEHKYFTLLWNYTKTKILMCVLLLVSLLQISSFRVLLWSSVYKHVSSNFALPKYLLFMCRDIAKTTCMPNLVMLITHFGQNRKYWPSKCPSRGMMIMRLFHSLTSLAAGKKSTELEISRAQTALSSTFHKCN